MKTKLLSLFIAISALFCLTSCEGWPQGYSEEINFYVSADCSADNTKKIEELFKRKALPVGDRISISVIVDGSATMDVRKRMLKEKVRDILKKSITEISDREFHALKTGATETIYTAKINATNEKIETIIAEHGQPY